MSRQLDTQLADCRSEASTDTGKSDKGEARGGSNENNENQVHSYAGAGLDCPGHLHIGVRVNNPLWGAGEQY